MITAGKRRRTRNPRGEGERLRAELLDVAARHLAESGDVEQLSLRGIAAEVGVAAPSIYNHFPNKSALLKAVVDREFEAFDEYVRARAARGKDPFDRLRRGGLGYLAFAGERPGAYTILFGTRRNESMPPLDVQWHEVDDPGLAAFGTLVSLIQDCLDTSPVGRQHDAFLIAVEGWTLLHGLADLKATLPSFPWPSSKRLVDAWAERFQDSLRTT
jgi:AcrR family transcriptional regulator